MTCSFKTEGKYGLHPGFAPAPGILKWVKQGKENKPTNQPTATKKTHPKTKPTKNPTGVQFANFEIWLFLQGDFQSRSSDRMEAPFKLWFNVVIYVPKLSHLLSAVELHLIKFWLERLVVKLAATVLTYRAVNEFYVLSWVWCFWLLEWMDC